MDKTKQKVSGAFRSWEGLVIHTNIRSFISTVKKRNINVVDSVRKIFKGEPVLSH
jgi:hypothetical protein